MKAGSDSLTTRSQHFLRGRSLQGLVAPGSLKEPAGRGLEAPSSNKLAFLDALRGFAAAWILVYHVWGLFYPQAMTQGEPLRYVPAGDDWLFWPTFCLCQFGFAAVQLFFVVSGFCIHYRQARAGPNASLELGDYARRRFWRIYPAYLASVLFAFIVLFMVQSGQHSLMECLEHYYYCIKYRTLGGFADVVVNATCTQLIWPQSLRLNGVYWTLVFEMQFYLVYPLFFWLRRRIGLWPLLLVFAAVEVAFCAYRLQPPLFFVYRFFEWLLGVLAAEWFVRPPSLAVWVSALVVAGISALAAVGGSFHEELFPFRDMFFATAFFGVVVGLSRVRGAEPGRYLRGLGRMMSWVGTSSYSLYLTHVPIVVLVCGLVHLAVERQNISTVTGSWLQLLIVPLAFVTGYVFFRLFERPFLPRKT